MENRILILSLGAGRKDTNKSAPEIYNSNRDDDVYQNTEYKFYDKDESQRSSFVAAPLIKRVEPDEIIMIGSVRSAWSQIYKEYYGGTESKCDQDVFIKLYETECKLGLSATTEEIDEIQNFINEKFNEDKVFAGLCDNAVIRVILTKYGINEAELAENYMRLSGLKDAFKEEADNIISFDITHSFRSMPLYNLVVLNYIKSLTQFKVEIANIFYGNLEISRENNNIAVITDLKELSNVLNLTGAVSEFKNSGSAKSVIPLLPVDTKEQRKVKNHLEEFDWAVQMNDLARIETMLRKLLNAIKNQIKDEKKRTAYFHDIYTMINEVLKENFPSVEMFNNLEHIADKPTCYGALQTKLGKWFLKTNRYGQAVLVAIEALRSYLVPIYLLKNKMEITYEACIEEKNRSGLEKVLQSVLDKELIDNDYRYLYSNLPRMKNLRNICAHNLSEGAASTWTVDDSRESIVELIHEYYDKLEKLEEEINSKWNGIKEEYTVLGKRNGGNS